MPILHYWDLVEWLTGKGCQCPTEMLSWCPSPTSLAFNLFFIPLLHFFPRSSAPSEQNSMEGFCFEAQVRSSWLLQKGAQGGAGCVCTSPAAPPLLKHQTPCREQEKVLILFVGWCPVLYACLVLFTLFPQEVFWQRLCSGALGSLPGPALCPTVLPRCGGFGFGQPPLVSQLCIRNWTY